MNQKRNEPNQQQDQGRQQQQNPGRGRDQKPGQQGGMGSDKSRQPQDKDKSSNQDDFARTEGGS